MWQYRAWDSYPDNRTKTILRQKKTLHKQNLPWWQNMATISKRPTDSTRNENERQNRATAVKAKELQYNTHDNFLLSISVIGRCSYRVRRERDHHHQVAKGSWAYRHRVLAVRWVGMEWDEDCSEWWEIVTENRYSDSSCSKTNLNRRKRCCWVKWQETGVRQRERKWTAGTRYVTI